MTPLVLIPGMMCDARMWGAVPDGLAVPVHHACPVGADTIADLAALLLRDLPDRFALAGLSMGGIVAMAMAALAPERVLRLALLDTNPRAETPQVQARRQPQIDRAARGDLAGVLRDDMIPHYLAAPDPAIEALCLDMALDAGPQVFRDQSIALRDRPDQQDALRGFTGPALVLTGAQDRLCPRDRHDLMHALMPQSDLVIIDGAGHVPPLEQPVATAAALRRWLET
ncbi:alpha/beta fold hydrolase [Yoonia vestfoldensis]|uniref:alpha/beta fold hydrolase n=1 Tax=Yoonia vestfoldensis TaxID=245188 RepID=UPI00036971C2|nr:alpha/beta fold hydrolase [Yoonia vestfoldensis]